MKIIFDLLANDDQNIAQQAWEMAARLPLYDKIFLNLDLSKEYVTRYWLYIVENENKFTKITKEVL